VNHAKRLNQSRYILGCQVGAENHVLTGTTDAPPEGSVFSVSGRLKKKHCKAYFGAAQNGGLCKKAGGWILTIYRLYEMFRRKKQPQFIGSRPGYSQFRGRNAPNTFWAVNRHFQARIVKYYNKLACHRKYCIDSNQILHSAW